MTFIDFAWSCVDHALSLNASAGATIVAFLFKYLRPMTLDLSSIGTLNIPPDGGSRHIGQMRIDALQALRYFFRRLVIEEVMVYVRAKLFVGGNLLAHSPSIPTPDIGRVLGDTRIIGSSFS